MWYLFSSMVLNAVQIGAGDGGESPETHLRGDRLAGLRILVSWLRWYS